MSVNYVLIYIHHRIYRSERDCDQTAALAPHPWILRGLGA